MLQLNLADPTHQEKTSAVTGKPKARTGKAKLGQFTTPATVARFMASLFPPSPLHTCAPCLRWAPSPDLPQPPAHGRDRTACG